MESHIVPSPQSLALTDTGLLTDAGLLIDGLAPSATFPVEGSGEWAPPAKKPEPKVAAASAKLADEQPAADKPLDAAETGYQFRHERQRFAIAEVFEKRHRIVLR